MFVKNGRKKHEITMQQAAKQNFLNNKKICNGTKHIHFFDQLFVFKEYGECLSSLTALQKLLPITRLLV